MNTINHFHLKLIPNFSYRKENLSLPLRNKDYYLFNLLHKKNKEKNESIKISDNVNNINNKIKITKKLMNLKEFNINNLYPKINIQNEKQDRSFKNLNNKLKKFFFFRNTKKEPKFSSSNNVKEDNTDKFDSSNKLTNPLIITSCNKVIINFKEKNKKRRNRLISLKRNFTFKDSKENEIKKLEENYFLSNSIQRNYSKLKNRRKKNEGTQINLDYNTFYKHKSFTTIYRKKYCSPKSIMFQNHFMKFKTLDNDRYI